MGTQGDGTEGEGNPLGQKIPRLHELTNFGCVLEGESWHMLHMKANQ